MGAEEKWELASWYYKRDGQLVGPLTVTLLQRFLAAKRLQPTDVVWQKWKQGNDTKLVPVRIADLRLHFL